MAGQIGFNRISNCQLHDIVEINDIILYENCPPLIHKSGFYLTVSEIGEQSDNIGDTDDGRLAASYILWRIRKTGKKDRDSQPTYSCLLFKSEHMHVNLP